MQALTTAPRGGEIVQTLGDGVEELLDEMIEKIGDQLLPLVRGLEKRAQLGDEDHRMKAQINRTLKNFDLLKQLLQTLRKLDTKSTIREVRKAEHEGASGRSS